MPELAVARAPELTDARAPVVASSPVYWLMVAACNGGADAFSYVPSINGGQIAAVANTGGETGKTGLGEGGAKKV
jgi:hypothetical protein